MARGVCTGPLYNYEIDLSAELSLVRDGHGMVRYRSRFFEQVGHETMYSSSENKHLK